MYVCLFLRMQKEKEFDSHGNADMNTSSSLRICWSEAISICKDVGAGETICIQNKREFHDVFFSLFLS